jgi:hypothetical protein
MAPMGWSASAWDILSVNQPIAAYDLPVLNPLVQTGDNHRVRLGTAGDHPETHPETRGPKPKWAGQPAAGSYKQTYKTNSPLYVLS